MSGATLVSMLFCGATGTILVIAAWLGLVGALALGAVPHGIGWEAAVAFANLAVAAALFCFLAAVAAAGALVRFSR
jgi:hypothetical protein